MAVEDNRHGKRSHAVKEKKWKVYVPEFLPPDKPQREILAKIAKIETGLAKDEAELIAKTSRADAVLLTLKTLMTRQVLESCPRLKIIGKYGVGTENIDIQAATELGIPVVNVPGLNSNAVAELSIGLILAVMRRIQEGKRHISAGGWRDESFLGDELIGSRVGIIGYGHIAKGVIRKLQGFEVGKILVFTESKRREKPEFKNVTLTNLQALLKESDIVTIHKSLTPQSQGLIGRREIGLMKKTAYLINTSRGSLVDERELIRALQARRIAGAALDVYEEEPLPRDHPLLFLDNVVLTPHIGGSTRRTRLQMVTAAARNVADFLEGQRIDPRCLVNQEVWKPAKTAKHRLKPL